MPKFILKVRNSAKHFKFTLKWAITVNFYVPFKIHVLTSYVQFPPKISRFTPPLLCITQQKTPKAKYLTFFCIIMMKNNWSTILKWKIQRVSAAKHLNQHFMTYKNLGHSLLKCKFFMFGLPAFKAYQHITNTASTIMHQKI